MSAHSRFDSIALILIALFGAGCADSNPLGPGKTEDPWRSSSAVVTVLRHRVPDSNTFLTDVGAEPESARGEEGVWRKEFGDPSLHAVRARAWFVNPDTGREVPVFVIVDDHARPGSLQIGLDTERGALRIFGLRHLEVWVEIEVAPRT